MLQDGKGNSHVVQFLCVGQFSRLLLPGDLQTSISSDAAPATSVPFYLLLEFMALGNCHAHTDCLLAICRWGPAQARFLGKTLDVVCEVIATPLVDMVQLSKFCTSSR